MHVRILNLIICREISSIGWIAAIYRIFFFQFNLKKKRKNPNCKMEVNSFDKRMWNCWIGQKNLLFTMNAAFFKD